MVVVDMKTPSQSRPKRPFPDRCEAGLPRPLRAHRALFVPVSPWILLLQVLKGNRGRSRPSIMSGGGGSAAPHLALGSAARVLRPRRSGESEGAATSSDEEVREAPPESAPRRRPGRPPGSTKKASNRNSEREGTPSSRNSTPPPKGARLRAAAGADRDNGGSNPSSRASSRDSSAPRRPSNGAAPTRSTRLRASLDDPDSKDTHSSKSNSGSSENSEEEEVRNDSREEEKNAPSLARVKCKLCETVVAGRTKLRRHAFDKHFKEEVCRDFPRSRPFGCPASPCGYKGDSYQGLVRHYGSKHTKLMEKFMPQVEVQKAESNPLLPNSSVSSATSDVEMVEVTPVPLSSAPPAAVPRGKDGGDSAGDADSEDSEEEQAEKSRKKKPSKAVASSSTPGKGRRPGPSKPTNMEDFRRQVSENLVTLDGCRAVAVDEKNIRCVCGKTVRLCGRYYWRYFVQKPNVKDGKVIQKGHWFNCAVVKEKGSRIKPHVVTEEELEASRNSFLEEQKKSRMLSGSDSDASEKEEQTSGGRHHKRRCRTKAAAAERELEEPETKRPKEEEDDAPSAPAFSMERHIRELLSTRVPGQTFVQDGPCFEMSHNIVMCHMCRATPAAERRAVLSKGRFNEEQCDDVSCCFYSFRKLRLTRDTGDLEEDGFLDPHEDPKEEDLRLWRPDPAAAPDVPAEMVRYTLGLIGDQVSGRKEVGISFLTTICFLLHSFATWCSTSVRMWRCTGRYRCGGRR